MKLTNTGTIQPISVSEVGITDGLVAWYPLDGNTRDYTEYRNDGTNNGATVAAGLGQLCYSFDGVDDYAEFGDNSNFGITNKLTLQYWVKPDWSNSSFTPVITKSTSPSNRLFQTWIGSDKLLDIEAVPYIKPFFDGTDYFISGNWYNISIVFDGVYAKCYIDGELKNTVESSLGDINDAPLRIGQHDRGHYGDGSIQDVRIYNRALSPEEIKILYELRKNKKTHFHQSGKVFVPSSFNEVY